MEFRDRINQGFLLTIRKAEEVAQRSPDQRGSFSAWARALREARQLWEDEAGSVSDASPVELLQGAIEAVIICEANLPVFSGDRAPAFLEGGIIPQWMEVLGQVQGSPSEETPPAAARRIALWWVTPENPDRKNPGIRRGLDSAACALLCQEYAKVEDVARAAQEILRDVGETAEVFHSQAEIPKKEREEKQARAAKAGRRTAGDGASEAASFSDIASGIAASLPMAVAVALAPPSREVVISTIAHAVVAEIGKRQGRRKSPIKRKKKKS